MKINTDNPIIKFSGKGKPFQYDKLLYATLNEYILDYKNARLDKLTDQDASICLARIIRTYQYTDFGETTIHGDDQADNEVCYTGGIYDQTTGLYYLNARYYDPEEGRFLTEDTYRGENDQPDTQHLYVYCANNPVNYVDPSGHFAIAVPILVKLVLVGGVVIYVSYSSWKRHSPKTRYAGRKISYKNTIFRWIAAKVIRHGIKQSQHGKNNVRKTGGKPSNRREEIREQKARGERNKRKRKGYKHSK